ncbi:glycosyltransferase [Cecembia calidifontis]|uniref:Glycosyltransferase involved in cell wall biosynthesis n=1 Tax=Cecembia calidifontis TaxID=1187080 RepID=A0A4Q7PF67_9BACT|nr:glycosyltransferase [Cecembia calidifontis]RZS98458.1 glycosyltransferase involved in cell wall biosynthesis [Cecembia calidifontis]
MKFKVLFNCSTNVVGGGVKNSAIFIKYAIEDSNIDWYFALSSQVYELVKKWGLVFKNNTYIVFEDSPARNKYAKRRLKDLVKQEEFKLVYTMAGPAYVQFSCIHLQGISNPFITHADWDAFSLMGNSFQIARYLFKSFVQLLFSRNADYFVFQTEQARLNYCKRALISNSKTFMVSNAFDDSLRTDGQIFRKKKDIATIFCPGADYTHKAFQFIPDIAKSLKEITDVDFKFILTLPDSKLWYGIKNKAIQLGVSDKIVNRGSFSYSEILKVYADADIVFVPSLLETFSASYLEAIALQKQLVVAEKGFAREICGDYAQYINPKNAIETAKVFKKLIENNEGNIDKSPIGNKILERFGSQKQRFEKLRGIVLDLVEKNQKK